MARRQLILVWEDERKQRATAFYETQSNPAPALSDAELAFASTLASISGCRLVAVRECREMGPGIAPAASPYDRVDDRLLVTGTSGAGRPLRFVVPGMVTAVLSGDLLHGDLSSPGLSAAISAAEAVLCDESGSPLVSVERATHYGVKIGRTNR